VPQRAGRSVTGSGCADEALLDLLVGLNWLQERDASDRAAIKAALKAMLADASMFRDAGR
jgi:hypothetical protein